MSDRVKEFESIRFVDRALTAEESDARAARKVQLLKEMTEEEFKEIIQGTIGTKAREAYQRAREE
jgi:hypothetical protein